jgi:hypothetical protein
MKKTYLRPAIDLLDAESEELLVTSFDSSLDSNNSIGTSEMLSRRGGRDIWDDEEDF